MCLYIYYLKIPCYIVTFRLHDNNLLLLSSIDYLSKSHALKCLFGWVFLFVGCFVCLFFVCLSVCLFLCLSVCLSACLFVCFCCFCCFCFVF